MSYHILFWMLCAVLAAHVVVAIIAVTKAYRDEGRSSFFKPAFPNGPRGTKGQSNERQEKHTAGRTRLLSASAYGGGSLSEHT
jgi:hypothetical protein